MKYLLTLTLIILSFTIQAQDTSRLRIKPIVATIEGDSIASIDFDHWRNSSSKSAMTLLIRYYGKDGKLLFSENMIVPDSIANRYIKNRAVIDSFILFKKTRLRKQ